MKSGPHHTTLLLLFQVLYGFGASVLRSHCGMPELANKLEFLQSPQAYGDPGLQVISLETHMSWVFLVSEQVFKLKKPVHFPFLDFSTLAAREHFCREELRLNARLAPGVYRGLMALQWRDGVFSLVPESELQAGLTPLGETVEWLVCMRRLPANRMLDHLMTQKQVSTEDVDAITQLLSDFYSDAPAALVSPADYLSRFQCEQASNREVLLRPQFQLPQAALAINRLDMALATGTELLYGRARQQRVLDGHGDLRPEHICMLRPPVAIDCLEFNPQLRQVDPFDELAYLALECAMAGLPWVGERLLRGCAAALHDHPAPALTHLYTAHRALLRARLAMAHLLDSEPRTPTKWAPQATRYIAHALVALDAFNSS